MNKNVPSYVDFFPLTVNYFEKFYSVGKFPGGFIKRENKPSEKEVLISRLIDRPLRPFFPEGFRNETQIIATVVSCDPQYSPDILAINGASAALTISDIPFNAPVGAVRVGKIDGELIINPTNDQLEASTINMTVAGTGKAIVMVEAGMKNVSEEEVLEALNFAHIYIKKLINVQLEMQRECGKQKFAYFDFKISQTLLSNVTTKVASRIEETITIPESVRRYEMLDKLMDDFTEECETLDEGEDSAVYNEAFETVKKEVFRRYLFEKQLRIDARRFDEIRPIDIEVSLLPKTHGSALFTRGETQALVTVTLGTKTDSQLVDNIEGESLKKFMLHYNFPPFCVGEIGMMRGPGRREIGHGALASRALEAVLPDGECFPYTIRVVSEILESNGSSSMATVCGGCLSLMDAGVPITDVVAGIAMGLIYEEGQYIVLTDIMGIEDHLGDMDFKVAGTTSGITALQMDIKIEGIDEKIMSEALSKAKAARLSVIEKMKQALPSPRPELSENAPRYETIRINPEKIGLVIGPAGKNIKSIIEETKASIDILDGGIINIFAKDKNSIEQAKDLIYGTIQELVEDTVYKAKVKKIVDYGAFVELLPVHVEGLLHISQIEKDKINNVRDYLKEDDIIEVKYLGLDSQGRIKLSRKVLL
jgi:polyribonucleotide nucleotidyltransferase